MRLQLNVLDRVLLFGLIANHPNFQQSSALTFRMRDAAMHVLSLEENDKVFFGIREVSSDDGKTTMFFDNKELCTKDMEYTLPDRLMADVVTTLRALDAEGKLNVDQNKLWMKLMPEEDKKKLEEGFNPDECKRVEVAA